MKNVRDALRELQILFDCFNHNYFYGDLQQVQLLIQHAGNNQKALGWITTKKVWKNETDSRYEINITAEYLNRGVEAVATTLLHEMVHLYCLQNGIKDVSRGGSYHNKTFKVEAELHGLTPEYDKRIGWSHCTLTHESKKLVDSCNISNESFSMYRDTLLKYSVKKPTGTTKTTGTENEPTKRKSSRKYQCPKCGVSVRATKAVNIGCFDCNVKMEEV